MSFDFSEPVRYGHAPELVEIEDETGLPQSVAQRDLVDIPLNEPEVAAEGSELLSPLEEAGMTLEMDRELLERARSAISRGMNYKHQSFGRVQEVLDSTSLCYFAMSAVLLAVILLVIAFRSSSAGHLAFPDFSALLVCTGCFGASLPCLSLVARQFESARCYLIAEGLHWLDFKVSALFSWVENYRICAALELARYYIKVGKYSEALTVVERFSAYKKDFTLAQHVKDMRINCMAHLGRIPEALKLAEESLTIFQSCVLSQEEKPVLEVRHHTLLADALLACNDIAGALRENYQAIKGILDCGKFRADELAQIASQLSQCYERLGDFDRAANWADTAIVYADKFDVPTKVRIQSLLARAKVLLHRGSETAASDLTEVRCLLASITGLALERAELAHLNGVLNAGNGNWKAAGEYFASAAATRFKLLRSHHFYTQESMRMHLLALEKSGDVRAGEILLAVEEAKPSTEEVGIITDRTRLERRTVGSNKFPVLGNVAFRLQFIASMTIALLNLGFHGFRAADFYVWWWLFLPLLFAVTTVSVYWGYRDQEKRLKEHLQTLTRKLVAVRFEERSGQTTGRGYFALLGEPFNTKIQVEHECRSLENYMAHHSLSHECVVGFVGEKPVVIETSYGMVGLKANGDSIAAAQDGTNHKYPLSKVLTTIGLFVCLANAGFFFFGFSNTTKAGHLPPNLTDFEYYRLAEYKIASAVRYGSSEDLQIARESFMSGGRMKGYWGQVSAACLEGEIPAAIPDESVLAYYKRGLDDDSSMPERIHGLEKCIQLEPKFEWAYAEMSRLQVADHDLESAAKNIAAGLSVNPESVPVLRAKAELQKSKGDLTGAWDTLNKIQKKDPMSLENYREMFALLLQKSG